MLELKVVKGSLRKMGSIKEVPKGFVEIKGIGNYKHNLSYTSEIEARMFINRMAKLVADEYMKESVRKQKKGE
jgi:hypothetical protein